MIKKVKEFFNDKKRLYLNLRWAAAFIILGYIALLKDTSVETVFVEPNEGAKRLIILEHIINEVDKKDTIIQIMYDEIPDYSGASADSLEREVARRYRQRKGL